MSLFRLEVTNKFPPYSHYLMHSVLSTLCLAAETRAQSVQLTYEDLFCLLLEEKQLVLFPEKAKVHSLNPTCFSYRGNLIL